MNDKNQLKAIDLSYNNNSKIDLEDYDEMTSAIENINSYFLGMYGKYTDFDEEVKEMVKSFYDPKVEERGVQKGIEKGIERGIEKGVERGKIEIAEEMIKEGESIEKIKKYTKLQENKILELIKQMENKKVQ
jgi:predicted transposase/invertase (TIGR01784 family)